MTAYVSQCGSDMRHSLDVMVSSVLSGKPPMQLAFNPYLFLFSHGTGVMWWYNPLMRAIIL